MLLVSEETVTVDIRVKFRRGTFTDGRTEWDQLGIRSVKPVWTALTAEEQDAISELIWESANSTEIINALVDALAGKKTKF